MDFVIRRQSEKIDSNYNEELNNTAEDDYDYRKWEWGYLRVRDRIVNVSVSKNYYNQLILPHLIFWKTKQTECENLFLESFYNTYVQRLQRSYLSIFLVIHTFVGIVHIVALVASTSVGLIYRILHPKQINIPMFTSLYK